MSKKKYRGGLKLPKFKEGDSGLIAQERINDFFGTDFSIYKDKEKKNKRRR